MKKLIIIILLLLCLTANVSHSQSVKMFGQIPSGQYAEGLVFYWRGIEAVEVVDESGYGNDGTIIGPTWVGDGLDFAAGTDLIALPTAFKPLDGGTGFTVILRVKLDNIGADQGLFYTDDHAASDPLLLWYDSPNGWAVLLNTSAGPTGARYGNTANVGQWYDLALWWDGATVKLFVDGVEESGITISLDGTLDVSTTGYGIGNNAANQSKGMDGIISNAFIYTRPLSVSEIQQLIINPDLPMQREPVWLFKAPVAPPSGIIPIIQAYTRRRRAA